MSDELFVARVSTAEVVKADWGELSWLFSGSLSPGTEMTLGRCLIEPGQKNPLHAHPNCEEMLFLFSGALEHSIDDALFELEPGHAIRVPAGAKHDARNVGDEPALMVICYSHPDREFVSYEQE